MTGPTISILMATYNGERYVSEQVESILEQTDPDWRLFISDDRSSDGTMSILDRYEKAHPEKINIARDDPSHRGAKERFGRLLSSTDSDYYMFCDQDDIWLPKKIEVERAAIRDLENQYGNKTPIAVHTDLTVTDKDLKVLHESFRGYQNLKLIKMQELNRLLIQNVVTGCTVMINRALRDRCLPIPAGAVLHDWWAGLVAVATGIIHYIDVSTVLYRQHHVNVTGAQKWGLQYIMQSIGGLKDKSEALKRSIVQAGELLRAHRHALDAGILETIESYAGLGGKSFFGKRYTVLRHHYFMSGFVRNIGVMLVV